MSKETSNKKRKKQYKACVACCGRVCLGHGQGDNFACSVVCFEVEEGAMYVRSTFCVGQKLVIWVRLHPFLWLR